MLGGLRSISGGTHFKKINVAVKKKDFIDPDA